jgi:hypothetical protein
VHGNAGEPGDKCECPAGEPLCRAIPPPPVDCNIKRRRLSASTAGDSTSLRSVDGEADALDEMREALQLTPSPSAAHGRALFAEQAIQCCYEQGAGRCCIDCCRRRRLRALSALEASGEISSEESSRRRLSCESE